MAYSTTQIESFRNELTPSKPPGRISFPVAWLPMWSSDGDSVQYHRVDIPLLTRRIGELESILSEVDNTGEYATSFKIISGKGL